MNPKKKKILITGAEGFIARNLSNLLKKNGHIIYGIGTKKFNREISKKFSYRILVNKKISIRNLKKNFKNIDLIIHCAGSALVGLDANNDYKKNYLTTKIILDFTIGLKKKPKIIFMSSYSVYGDLYTRAISEDSPTKPSTTYAYTKKLSEDILINFSNLYNLDVVILRLASVYGEGLTKQLIFDACKKIANNRPNFFGRGIEIRDWIHVSDVCNLVLKIINKDFNSNSIINCGSGKGYKIKYLINLIKKNIKTKNRIKFFKSKKTGPKVLITNIEIAKKYNWTPKVNLKTGILNYIKWYQNLNKNSKKL